MSLSFLIAQSPAIFGLRYLRNAISKNPLNKKYFSLANHNNQRENNHFKLKILQFYHETFPMV